MSTMGDVIYLTGCTGFIGDVIVRQCEENDAVAKIYCPIREKNGSKGFERFVAQFSSCKKAKYLDPSDHLPADVTLIILNAYSVKFFNDVSVILEENVSPMIELLDQCRDAGSRIRGISIVSTAYVQEPLPFKRNPLNQIQFVLKDHTTAFGLYEDLVTKKSTTWSDMQTSLDKVSSFSNHYKFNNYVFSKHVMEHIVHERYSSLPICVVRPSIVAHSRDGKFGHGHKTGFPLFLKIAKRPVLRFPRNEGNLDLVFVDSVAQDIVRAASEMAAPAVLASSGSLFHPILSCTSGFDLAPIEMFQIGAPSTWRFDIRNSVIRTILRSMEILFVYLIAGAKKANLLELVYQNFDHIMEATWDFEQRHQMTVPEFVGSVARFYAINEEASGENSKVLKPLFGEWLSVAIFSASLVSGWINPNSLLSPCQQTVVLFVSLRMLVLLTMQALFYGETALRESLQTTINKRDYGTDQHERETEIWPSVLFSGLELYVVFQVGLLPDPSTMPLITASNIAGVILTHALPVEFLYYWAHRLMHSNANIYKIHRHHHRSVVPTPKTSVSFLWSEHLFYDTLFALPVLVPALLGTASLASVLLYIPLFDAINSLGHTNLEIFPDWYLDSWIFPFFYCCSYHGVHHHSNPNANFALFMPVYDILFGTYSDKHTRKDFFRARAALSASDG